jgi:hypothetical protein
MRRTVLVCLGVAALLAATAGEASTFIHMSRGELVRNSDAAVVGTVSEVQSFWSESGRVIVTEARIRVADRIFGDTPDEIVVRTFGGTVGAYSVEAHGFNEFVAGQRLVAYVKATEPGRYEVTGYRQGQYRILTDGAGNDVAYSAVEDGVRYLRADGRAMEAEPPVALGRLRAEIARTAAKIEQER